MQLNLSHGNSISTHKLKVESTTTPEHKQALCYTISEDKDGQPLHLKSYLAESKCIPSKNMHVPLDYAIRYSEKKKVNW